MYWALIPASNRKTCLFCESCSNYVYNITKKQGLFRGIKALVYRYKNCRPGYQIITIDKEPYLITANHEIFPAAQIRDTLYN